MCDILNVPSSITLCRICTLAPSYFSFYVILNDAKHLINENFHTFENEFFL